MAHITITQDQAKALVAEHKSTIAGIYGSANRNDFFVSFFAGDRSAGAYRIDVGTLESARQVASEIGLAWASVNGRVAQPL